eukprot:CAMPEP_0117420230 /NCGR_PEP_ID=MMETSP0758-20121206/1607_1 /TAXON_ID=63605 /ORGANISM="Percolomonas cosmopolitus, Strain AE-1 (ATCC 50343)" /LENGTH=785 /DNA_ID=CAMNT_0005201717 /DNA_START=775 /DNA_END=3129 /DNA_ORIENTATION=-
MLILNVEGSKAALIAQQYLRSKGHVHFVSVKPPTITHNRYAKGVIQSNRKPEQSPLPSSLNGQGQIIGVGDTGIDTNHCFFYDTQDINRFDEMDQSDPKKNKHRKIKAYWNFMDNKDSEGGHGTHVSATATGDSIDNNNIKSYNALANKAKIAFLDAGCDTDSCKCPKGTDCECNFKPNGICPKKIGVVYLPNKLSQGYFPFFKQEGAHISSASWGTGFYHDFSFGYSSQTKDIDEYVWDNPDFLPIFAAGNSGGVFGYASLTSESESKNSIAVGATRSTLNSFKTSIDFINFDLIAAKIKVELLSVYCVPQEHSPIGHFVPTNQWPSLCENAKTFKKEDCCAKGNQQKNATMCGTQEFIPFKKIGFRCCKECIEWEMDNIKDRYTPNNMASFSARGPTIDGRIKPDVVAVGDQIVSAKANPNSVACSKDDLFKDVMTSHEGTSMATPVVASAAAIVRQFFVDGHYPLTVNKVDLANKIEPSAALVKAMIIHSGTAIDGFIHLNSIKDWFPIGKPKDGKHFKFELQTPYFRGFGSVSLDKVLSGQENEEKNRLYLPNPKEDVVIKQNEVHSYCIHAISFKSDFKITLTWTDPPSSPSARMNLVNDLDLIVVSPSGKVYYGNGKSSVIGYERESPDSQNNVEQIAFTGGEEPGYYHVIVRGTDIPQPIYKGKSQRYALVMTGDIRKSRFSSNCKPFTVGLIPQVNHYFRLTIIFGVLCLLLIPALIATSLYFFIMYRRILSNKGYRYDPSLNTKDSAAALLGSNEKENDSDDEIELDETPDQYVQF